MNIREATEADAAVLAAMTDQSAAAIRMLVHDRTVRVAVADEDVIGGICFTASRDAVHVTWLVGAARSFEALLGEPIAFADADGLPVESIVSQADQAVRESFEAAGFAAIEAGPQFDNESTVHYRREP